MRAVRVGLGALDLLAAGERALYWAGECIGGAEGRLGYLRRRRVTIELREAAAPPGPTGPIYGCQR